MASYSITWIERGTNNAACLGFDGIIEDVADSAEDIRDAALYQGECAGIDLARYEPVVDPIESDDSAE